MIVIQHPIQKTKDIACKYSRLFSLFATRDFSEERHVHLRLNDRNLIHTDDLESVQNLIRSNWWTLIFVLTTVYK